MNEISGWIVCRKNPETFCYCERSEESLCLFLRRNRGEIPGGARNDKINCFSPAFRGC